MNPFINILLSRGFVEGISGRFLSPDSKYGDGVVVELRDNIGRCHLPIHAVIATWKGGRTLFNANVPSDVEKFRLEVV